jgi:hypothetical protein
VRTYFDASVIVALFMHDTFSERADEFGRSGAVVPVVSDFGAAEFSSAVARRVRTGDIPIDRARVTLSRFDRWHSEIAGGIEIGPGDIRARLRFFGASTSICARRTPFTWRSRSASEFLSLPSMTGWRRRLGHSASRPSKSDQRFHTLPTVFSRYLGVDLGPAGRLSDSLRAWRVLE